MSEKISGVLEKIVWADEDSHFTIAVISRENVDVFERETTIKGVMPGVQCGETLELDGDWINDKKYGRQFAVKNFKSILPASVHGIRKYLSSKFVEGIGKTYANRIVDKFGADTLRVISEEAGRLREIRGISDHRVKIIHQAWEKHRRQHELFSEMQTYGITIGQCAKILDFYGEFAMLTIRENPYRLAYDIRGIAFPTADKIAKNLGFANENQHRVSAGIFYTFEEFETDGHTAVPAGTLVAKAAEKLEVSRERVEEILRELVGKAKVRIFGGSAGTESSHEGHEEHEDFLGARANARANEVDGNENSSNDCALAQSSKKPSCPSCFSCDILQRPSLANAEAEIAEKVREIQRSRSALPAIKIEIAAQWAQDRAGFAFAPEQIAAVKTALAEKFSIITGGPGTGKTTILSALCKILVAKKTIKIKLAAPTGRAAQRMSESTGVPAQTIHRMLNIQRERQKDADEESRELIADGNAPKSEFLDADFVIVDEASMLDVRLAARLLSAINPLAHVVFVGDVNQLPSIGPGNVLSDLIGAGTVPTTRLQAIFRQGARSGIVTTAHNVLHGNANLPAKILSFSEINPANDIFYFPCATPDECQRKVLTLISQILPRVFGFDSVDDVQILTAMHKGVVGVQMLNAYLQKLLKNQPLAGTETRHFELGDKVIQTRNNYDKNVFNGDMGIVTKIDKTDDKIVVQFDKECVDYTFSEAASELLLAYAMTIHKSQGSEFPAVIIPLVKAQWAMLRRNLIYTAITRGRRKVFVVAQDGAYFMAVKNNESSQRVTTLRERLIFGGNADIVDSVD